MKKIILFLMISIMSYGMEVATTIFPIYDAVKVIGGDKVDVTLLVKPGVEPHSFEPSPRDIAKINKSTVFLYLDESMETWIDKFQKNIEVESVRLSRGIDLVGMDGEDDHGHSGHSHAKDPHIWLDPLLYISIVENITEELVKQDKENKDYYEANLREYKINLESLHREILEIAENTENKIIYAGHFSFGYFVRQYNLEYITVYKNLSPNANISPRDLQNIIEKVKTSGQKYIYRETMVSSKTADLIARETGTKVLLLHQLGGVTKDEMKSGKGYIDLMEENIESLKIGLK